MQDVVPIPEGRRRFQLKALDEIKARCEAATPEIDTFIQAVSDGAHSTWPDYWRGFADNAQREAISMRDLARTDIPKLLAVIDKLKRQRNSYMELFQLEDPVNHPPLERLKEECEEEIDRILNGEGE